MKDIYKFLFSSIIVLSIVFLVDCVLGTILNNNAVFIDQPKYKRIPSANDSIIVLGASRAENQYVSTIIQESFNLPTYNYGLGAQNVYTNYAILSLILRKSLAKPQIVIWDFYYTDILNSPGWNTEKLYRLYSAYDYDDTIKSVVNLQGEEKALLLSTIKMYKFNSKLPRILMRERYSGTERGYSPLYINHNEPIKEYSQDRSNLDSTKITYIKKLIELCKSNNVKLFVFISPAYYKISEYNSGDWSSVMERICSNNSIPFFNFEQDSLFLSHPEWFYNDIHLNNIGAKEYTQLVVDSVNTYLKCDK